MDDRVRLSDDMLIEFLIHLPIKSLMRFNCVSRNWRTLIKSPTFLIRHLKCERKDILLVKRYVPPENRVVDDLRQPGGDDILSCHDPDSPELLVSSSLVVPFLDGIAAPARYQLSLMGPSFGLVCLIFHEIIVLCNPALREFKLLDRSPFACAEAYWALNYGSGFGFFDDNCNAYKIIQMWKVTECGVDYYDFDEYTRTDLYNSSTNSWKTLEVEVPSVRYDPGFDILFNGSCHWNADDFIAGPPAMGIILSFNLSTEVFHKFEFPNWFDDGRYPGLVVLHKCLALVRYSNWVKESHPIDIWIMKEYGMKDSWTKEFVIGPYLFICPLSCWRNSWLLVESRDSQLASCALHVNQVNEFQFLHGFEGSFRALIFTESIISLG